FIHHQGAVRPWTCSTGVLHPFVVRKKGGDRHVDTLSAAEWRWLLCRGICRPVMRACAMVAGVPDLCCE
ncbi:MAG: hypothetical protein UDG94_04325, partial [Peptococcaceae bacterium]|nr:hypothetical protein [Peptococcaceae bacterium]